MNEIPKQRGLRISPQLEVRNHTGAEITVQQQYAEIRINLAKVKPPVIVTISPGRKVDGSG